VLYRRRYSPIRAVTRSLHLSFLQPVADELITDVGLDGLCRFDIGGAASPVALLELASPRPKSALASFRGGSQRSIVVIDSSVELAHLQIDQPTRGICRSAGRLGLERPIAVRQRRL
jgi:hypothetical protein